MIYLFCFVISNVAFTQTLRYGQRHDRNTFAVVAVNYVFAALFSLAIFLYQGVDFRSELTYIVAATGFANGILFFAHVLFVLAAYNRVGVSITTALVGSGIIIPAVVSWIAWQETMTPYRWVALVLVPFAMALMRPTEASHPRVKLRGDLILFFSFLIAGVIFTIHKFSEIHFEPDQLEVYKVILFATSAFFSVTYTIFRRIHYSARDIGVGLFLGFSNALGLFFILLGLEAIHAVVFYPTSGILVICINAIVSRFIWQELLIKRQILGLVVAIAIVLLTNLYTD